MARCGWGAFQFQLLGAIQTTSGIGAGLGPAGSERTRCRHGYGAYPKPVAPPARPDRPPALQAWAWRRLLGPLERSRRLWPGRDRALSGGLLLRQFSRQDRVALSRSAAFGAGAQRQSNRRLGFRALPRRSSQIAAYRRISVSVQPPVPPRLGTGG